MPCWINSKVILQNQSEETWFEWYEEAHRCAWDIRKYGSAIEQEPRVAHSFESLCLSSLLQGCWFALFLGDLYVKSRGQHEAHSDQVDNQEARKGNERYEVTEKTIDYATDHWAHHEADASSWLSET